MPSQEDSKSASAVSKTDVRPESTRSPERQWGLIRIKLPGMEIQGRRWRAIATVSLPDASRHQC
jgi:hypothetical protein